MAFSRDDNDADALAKVTGCMCMMGDWRRLDVMHVSTSFIVHSAFLM